MKKELTMSLVTLLALAAVALCLRQALLQPAAGVLNHSYLGALVLSGLALFLLGGAFVRRLF